MLSYSFPPLWQVSVRHQDNHVSCSCKLFFRRGYLCRHAFAALHQCGIKQIPRDFVKPRWQKNAIRNHSFLSSSNNGDTCVDRDRAKLKRTRAWFEFNNCISVAGDSEEFLDTVLNGLKSVHSSLSEKKGSCNIDNSSNRADKFIGPMSESEISVRNPNISRNKGCGSRIKSSREISLENKGTRKCSICNKVGRHNARTCPEGKNVSNSLGCKYFDSVTF